MNPATKLHDLASSAPESIALEFPDLSFTVGNLAALVVSFAEKMRLLDISEGSLVELGEGDDLVSLAACFATAALGAKIFIVDEGLRNSVSMETDVCLTTENTLSSRTGDRKNTVVIDETWGPKSGSGAADLHAPVDGDGTWLLLFTAWTLGHPRLLSITRETFSDRVKAAAEMAPRSGKKVLALPGLGRAARLMEAMRCILSGGVWIGGKPSERAFEAAHDDGALVVVGSAPDLLGYARRTTSKALGSAELIVSFFLDADLSPISEQFESVAVSVAPLELGPVCILPVKDGMLHPLFEEASLGGSEIMLIDSQGSPVEEGDTGIAMIRTPFMAEILDRNDFEKAAARRKGFLPLGRVGRRLDGGRIEIGQTSHYLLTDTGRIVDAAEVEDCCRMGHGILDAVAFLNPKQGASREFFAFLKAEKGGNRLQLIASAKYHVRKRVGSSAVPRIIQIIADIPRDSFGRPDREACANVILQAQRRES
ncbi:hypothetical protein HKCCSP123_12880 [Rhodobacterales bacterium HKCCSP123]|nr:hypothetical protein [Rhodobacterales bacterium HKCCSP123]